MFMFNVKNISKMMVALLATAVVTSFSVGTAEACYGGAEGTKGCTSGASESIKDVGDDVASGSGVENASAVYTGSNDGFLGSHDDFVGAK